MPLEMAHRRPQRTRLADPATSRTTVSGSYGIGPETLAFPM